jgi:16S rRNA (guanine527-N7)-methyltransferase
MADALPASLRPVGTASAPESGVRVRDREPLPRDPALLPPMGETFRAALDGALTQLALELTPGMRAAIDAHARLLLAWNAHVNLTAIRGEGAIALEHVADSLAAVPLLLDLLADGRAHRRTVRLLDLGSGAGYPGIPVAVAVPVAGAALVDSVAKKTAFLDVVTAAARNAVSAAGEEPPALRAVRCRAEDLGHDPAHRGRWDVVTGRAVALLPVLVELALPLLRRGGVLVAWKRDPGDGGLETEVDEARPLLTPLGASAAVRVEHVRLVGLEDHRLVVVTKYATTPSRFPRPTQHLGRPPDR